MRARDETGPNVLPFRRLIFLPAFRQIFAFQLFQVHGKDGVRGLREPLAFLGRLKNQRDDDQRNDDDGKDREIKFPQLLLIDLAGKNGQLGGMLRVTLDRGAVLLHIRQ